MHFNDVYDAIFKFDFGRNMIFFCNIDMKLYSHSKMIEL